jgi:hypothetical protein
VISLLTIITKRKYESELDIQMNTADTAQISVALNSKRPELGIYA